MRFGLFINRHHIGTQIELKQSIWIDLCEILTFLDLQPPVSRQR